MSANANGSNTIQELAGQGQSLWLNNLLRDMIGSGELARQRDAPSSAPGAPWCEPRRVCQDQARDALSAGSLLVKATLLGGCDGCLQLGDERLT
jgi:hypothetical protein